MGCLKLTIKVGIIFLAVVGAITIFSGNFKFNLKENMRKRDDLVNSAKVFGNFSSLDSDYKIGRTFSLFGVKKMTITNTPTGQKTTFLYFKKAPKLTQYSVSKVEKDFLEFFNKVENCPLKPDNFKITGSGNFIISGKPSKYYNFEFEVQKPFLKKYSGQLGVYEKNGETHFHYMIHNTKRVSYKINNEIISKMKLN